MNIHHCGLHYDEIRRNIELSTYGVFAEPDAAYSPEWLHSFLSERMRQPYNGRTRKPHGRTGGRTEA